MIGYRARATRAVVLLWLLIAVSDAVTAVTVVGVVPSVSVLGGVGLIALAGFGVRANLLTRRRQPAGAPDDDRSRR